jgi:hypothetical protein
MNIPRKKLGATLGLLALLALQSQAMLTHPGLPQLTQQQRFDIPAVFPPHGAICSNDPINHTDPLGLWGAGGHYYTVLIVARAAGYSAQEATKLAFYAQMPDQINEYTAIEGAGGVWNCAAQALDPLPWFTRKQRLTQSVGHALRGGEAAPIRKAYATHFGELASLMEKGVALHSFGDLFAHSYKKDGKDVLYPTGRGHVLSGHTPDQIGEHYEQYSKYVQALYSMLKSSKKGGKTNDRLIQDLLTAAYGFGKEYTVVAESVADSPGNSYYDFKAENARMRQLAEHALSDSGVTLSRFTPEDLEAVPYESFEKDIREAFLTPEPIEQRQYLDLMRRMEGWK